jgi:hypothetical protein
MRLVICGEFLRVDMVYAINGLYLFAIPLSVTIEIVEMEKGLDVEGVTAVPVSASHNDSLSDGIPTYDVLMPSVWPR